MNKGEYFCISCGKAIDDSVRKKKTGVLIAVVMAFMVIITATTVTLGFVAYKKASVSVPETSTAPQQTTAPATEKPTSAEQTTFNIVSDIEKTIYYVSQDTPDDAGLVVRKEGTYYSDKIAVLKEGTRVYISSDEIRNGEYIQISFDLNGAQADGWVLKKYLVANCKAGDVITFGSYEQDGNLNNGKEPIEWIVLFVQPHEVGYLYHLVSKDALDSKPYNNIAGNVNWKTSSIRKWLHDDFMQNAFSEKERQSLCIVDTDYVRLLSKNEVNKAVADGWDSKTSASEYAQMNGAYMEGGYCGYWLMDSGDSSRVAARVNIHGKVLTSYSESEGGVERTDYAVRPVITIY